MTATISSLILKRAAASRTFGEWREDDYDVVADGIVVAHIMKATAAPEGTPSSKPNLSRRLTKSSAWMTMPLFQARMNACTV
jgi:hypothetical protein